MSGKEKYEEIARILTPIREFIDPIHPSCTIPM